MNRIKEYILKRYDVLILFLIIILLLGFCFDIDLTANDELWNFQSIYKMRNGYTIYKDFNVIVTPIFFILGNFIFKIFGDNFFVFRIYNLCICTGVFFFIYILFKNLQIKKTKASMYMLVGYLMFYSNVLAGANYNMLAIFITIVGINISIKYFGKKDRNIYYQGIIIVLIFMTKQNIGIFYLIGTIFYEFILIKNKKNAIKYIIKQLSISFSIGIIIIIILYENNILKDILDYTVLGLFQFGSNNIGGNILNLIEGISIIIISISTTLILIKKKLVSLSEIKNFVILAVYMIFMLFVMYPIYNDYHSNMSYIYIYIYIIFLIEIMIGQRISINNKFVNFLLNGIILIYCVFSIYFFREWMYTLNDNYEFEYNDPYFGVIFEDGETYRKINNITEYIKNNDKKVIIFSKEAALYMVPLKLNNEYFDLPFLRKFWKKKRKSNNKGIVGNG